MLRELDYAIKSILVYSLTTELVVHLMDKNKHDKANLKNIFVSPYPTLFLQYWVGHSDFFSTFQISYP